MKPQLIPDNLVRLMDKKDRDQLGAVTNEEREVIQTAKAEKELQREIRQYLNLLEIEHICPPMNKRSMLPSGWPDLTLCYKGTPICFEVKVGKNTPRPEQTDMHYRLRVNGWQVYVIRKLLEVKEILKGIE